MLMQFETDDPRREEAGDETVPADRDERRIEALERLFRNAHEGEGRLDAAAMRKIGAALRGEAPSE